MSIVARASPGIELSTSPPCMRVTCSVRPSRARSSAAMRGSSRASASTALRPCSGSEPACAERPCATTSSQRPPLRAATTAPPGRPHSMQSTASNPASRACVAIGSERISSSGTRHELEAREGPLAGGQQPRGVRRHGDAALHVRRPRARSGARPRAAAVAARACRAGRRCRDGRAARRARARRPRAPRARAGRRATARARPRGRSP